VRPRQLRPIVDGKIFNSRGALVAIVVGPAIFDLKGKKFYDLRGINIYKLSGVLVGHLPDQNTKRNLDKSTDKLFPAS
jgi:hypothetical protein